MQLLATRSCRGEQEVESELVCDGPFDVVCCAEGRGEEQASAWTLF